MVVLLRSLSQFISDGHRSPLSSDHSLSIVTGSDGDLKDKGARCMHKFLQHQMVLWRLEHWSSEQIVETQEPREEESIDSVLI